MGAIYVQVISKTKYRQCKEMKYTLGVYIEFATLFFFGFGNGGADSLGLTYHIITVFGT
jgi:hypothetical protein